MPERPIPDRSRMLMVCAGAQGILALALYFTLPEPPTTILGYTVFLAVILNQFAMHLSLPEDFEIEDLQIVLGMAIAVGGLLILLQLLGMGLLVARLSTAATPNSQVLPPTNLEAAAMVLSFCLACANGALLISVCRRARQAWAAPRVDAT